jgi:DNA gyrase subunit A
MAKETGRVIPVAIEDEVKESYLNYAMSVIVSRALPDVRDGLKPVHRRILYGMNDMGLRSDRPTKKCARIIGDVLGRYHPHGELSVYDALVRMAQDFSLRYTMVEGQGNFGSIEGDPPAATRYTEARLTKIADEMLRDINKETVDFGSNYDDTLQEPLVLPGAIPFLLINGASGIAVGMATNMAPHNLKESAYAVAAMIDNPDITLDELLNYIKGPDFPTGGLIFGRKGIRDAYSTGRGKIAVRSKFTIETTPTGRDVIIVSEIPYQVNLSTLIIRIADLVRDKKVDGISDLRNESDKDGLRVVIELKRGVSPKIILNQLFSNTQLQVNFNVNALALVNGRPEVLTLKKILSCFIEHRKDVVIRKTKYDLRKAEERAHILEGLKIALDNIDEVIALIKSSKTVNEAREGLQSNFELTEVQAQAILNMQLQKLTSLETQKIIDELQELIALIKELKELLSDESKILNLVKEETLAAAEKYGDDRKTEIISDEVEEINIEDLIQKEDMVVLISHKGFIKRVPLTSYRRQGRGGKGSSSTVLKDEDFIQDIFIASTHDFIMIFSSEGKAYWVKVHEIPEASRSARGQHIKTLLAITTDEEVAAVVSLDKFSSEKQVLMATSKGVVKKVTVDSFANAKTRGIIAIKLDQGDKLVSVLLTSGNDDVVLATKSGNALRLSEKSIRTMGRSSRGVQGIRLNPVDELVGAVTVDQEEQLFLITENGFGKRSEYDNFTTHGRGTKGQIAYKTGDKYGELAGILKVKEEDDIMIISSQGNTVKLKVEEVPILGKHAVGVKIVNIEQPDFVVAIDRIAKDEG